MKTFKLFCNPGEGVSYMLIRSMIRAKLEVDMKNHKEHPDEFVKHNVKTCPVLIIFEDDQETERIQVVQEILNYFIENNKIK
jgi:hypothetical protein